MRLFVWKVEIHVQQYTYRNSSVHLCVHDARTLSEFLDL